MLDDLKFVLIMLVVLALTAATTFYIWKWLLKYRHIRLEVQTTFLMAGPIGAVYLALIGIPLCPC